MMDQATHAWTVGARMAWRHNRPGRQTPYRSNLSELPGSIILDAPALRARARNSGIADSITKYSRIDDVSAQSPYL